MTAFSLLIEKIQKGKNPYASFPVSEWSGAWYGDPGAKREIFNRAIGATKPGIIIEVGSFVGESAIHMAGIIKQQGMDAAILAVDTWAGGFDHYVGAPEKLNMHYGRSDLYYRFLANVIANQCQDVIVPFAMDSIGASRVIKWLGLVPSLVYCDGSHEEGDVIRDLQAYWDLLPSGGGLLADDFSGHFPGVLRDGERFMQQNGVRPDIIEGEKVLFIK